MTRGRISSSCRSSHGAHASISSGCGIAVARRPALHDVRDVDVGAGEPDALDQLRQQLPGAADERLTLQVFLLPGPSPTNIRSASARPDAEHDLRPPGRELAQRAVARRGRDLGQRRTGRVRGMRRCGGRVERHGTPRSGHDRLLSGCDRAANRRRPRRRRPSPRSRSRCASTGAGRQRDREVAVEARVRRAQRPGDAVVRALRDEMAAELVARGVGDDDDERGVRALLLERPRASGNAAASAGAVEPATTRPSAPSTSPTALTTASATTCASSTRRVRDTEPAGHRDSRPRHFPTVAPRPAPTRPVANGSSRAAAATAAVPLVGAGRRAARLDQVEDRTPSARSAPGRPRSGSPARVAASYAHHAVGGREPERGAAGEHDRVDLRDDARRLEQRDLTRGRRAAAHLAAADRPLREQHDGHAGRVAGPVPGAHARHGQLAHGREFRRVSDGASAPTSRAKSTIRSSSSSVRSSISMCPPPGTSSSRAPGISSRDLPRLARAA